MAGPASLNVRPRALLAAGLMALAATGLLVAPPVKAQAPERVQDLSYGTILYDYYRGDFFQALTRFDVANARGGIQGHGDHPLLVEGGLMLAYGMTRSSRDRFETVLEQTDLPASQGNRAWFYLGKVFYLEGDREGAADAFKRVDGESLAASASDLWEQWLYYRAQLQLQGVREGEGQGEGDALARALEQLPPASAYRGYLRYNQALGLPEAEAIAALERLATDLEGRWQRLEAREKPEEKPDRAEDQNDGDAAGQLPPEMGPQTLATAEALALWERTQLTLGQHQLRAGAFEQALETLGRVGLDSLVADRALFALAVAATQAQQHGLALEALNRLNARRRFTPGLQQVPYARGFVLEQRGRQGSALEAYTQAAAHYEDQLARLQGESRALTERALLERLKLAGEERSFADRLGDASLPVDSLGRLPVEPTDFSLARLAARESFQLALRDLHEVYRLQRTLERRAREFDAFDAMLETRAQHRARRLAETRQALETLNADRWSEAHARFSQAIERALAREDAEFFMSTRQKKIQARLDRTGRLLERFPEGDERVAQQRRTYQRMRAILLWERENDYHVNRWAAQKQLRGLDRAMAEFRERRQKLEREMAVDRRTQRLAARVDRQRAALEKLRSELDSTLGAARERLLALVRDELDSQRQQLARWLRASRRAQARLTDSLHRSESPRDQGGAP